MWSVPVEAVVDVRSVRLAGGRGHGLKLVLRTALALGEANANAMVAKHRAAAQGGGGGSGRGYGGGGSSSSVVRPGVVYEASEQLELWFQSYLETMVGRQAGSGGGGGAVCLVGHA